MMMDIFFLVPFDKWSCLVMIDDEAFLNCFLIIICPSALLASLDETYHKFVLRNIKLYHRCDFMSAFVKHSLQCLCLRYGTWETVEDNALVFLSETVINGCKYVHHQVVRNQLTVVNISFCCLALFCSVLNFIAKYVACRDVFKTILLNHFLTLRSLA